MEDEVETVGLQGYVLGVHGEKLEATTQDIRLGENRRC